MTSLRQTNQIARTVDIAAAKHSAAVPDRRLDYAPKPAQIRTMTDLLMLAIACAPALGGLAMIFAEAWEIGHAGITERPLVNDERVLDPLDVRSQPAAKHEEPRQ